MDELTPAFEKSLFDSTLSGTCINMAELGIDSLLDDGIFKDVPIVSTLIGLGKTAQNIHDRNLLKQALKFINTFNEKSIDSEKLEKYKKRLNAKPKFAEEELGRILILLNSFIDLKKSEILAKFYRAYVEEKISWDTFCEFADVVSRLFVNDINLLINIFTQKISDTSMCKNHQIQRLQSLGLINVEAKYKARYNAGAVKEPFDRISSNSIGNNFCDIILNM